MSAIISPLMQHDFVTKKEFGEFKGEMHDFRDEMYEFRSDVNGRFDEIKHEMTLHKEEIKGYFDHSIGAMHEKFREDVQISMEYVQGIDKNKVDVRDFEVVRHQVAELIKKRKK